MGKARFRKRLLSSTIASCFVLGALSLTATPAHADPSWLLPVGVNVGGALHPNGVPGGAIIGGEASLAHVSWSNTRFVQYPDSWEGGYVDMVYDHAAKRSRFTVGPEVGVLFVGIDGGFVGQFGGGAFHPGFAFRPLLTLGFLSIYGRFGWIPGDPEVNRFTEIGVLLKWPIGLDERYP
jgi:hypothetical protein